MTKECKQQQQQLQITLYSIQLSTSIIFIIINSNANYLRALTTLFHTVYSTNWYNSMATNQFVFYCCCFHFAFYTRSHAIVAFVHSICERCNERSEENNDCRLNATLSIDHAQWNSYPAPMYPDVTTASPGPRNMQVKLNRLSRPVCTLSENCTTTMFVIVSPY